MKSHASICCLLFLVFFTCKGFSNSPGNKPSALLMIQKGEKFGFMDQHGKIVIEPVFRSLNLFSEGLSAARQDGLFGFIDEKGVFVIPPVYEYASSFVNGYSIIYQNGKPNAIDHSGTLLFSKEAPYKVIYDYNNSLFLFKTYTDKYGAVNNKSELIIDSVYTEIRSFADGLIIGYTDQHTDSVCVIDSSGRIIVPVGKYQSINTFNNGYAHVQCTIADGDVKGWGGKDAIINTKGEIVYKENDKKRSYDIDNDFSEGMAIIHEYAYKENQKDIMGVLDMQTRQLYEISDAKNIGQFSCNRAVVSDNNWNYYIIDKQGKRTSSKKYGYIFNQQFFNNMAIVEDLNRNGYQLVDTNETVLSTLSATRSFNLETVIQDKYIVFSDASDYKKGLMDLKGKEILPAEYDYISSDGFVNGNILVMKNHQQIYLNEKINVNWEEDTMAGKQPAFFNTTDMLRAHCYAYTIKRDSIDKYGVQQNWEDVKRMFPESKLYFTVTDEDTLLYDKYFSKKLYLANNTKDSIQFNTQDHRLYITIQAKDKKGEWKDIEYTPSSWCGNSYYNVQLNAQEYWCFAMPVYRGTFETKIRAKLQYNIKRDQKPTVIYSEEIPASINLSQFWLKEGHVATDIMDPYND